VTGGVKGFWSGVDGDDTVTTRMGGVVVDPTGVVTASGPTLRTKTDRDVDYWVGRPSSNSANPQTVETRPNLYRNDYFIIGADVRGIDQDNPQREGRPL